MTHRAKTSRGLVRGRIIHFRMCQKSSRGLKNKWDSPQIKTSEHMHGEGEPFECCSISGGEKKKKNPESWRLLLQWNVTKSLISSFRDSYFSHSRGSCKLKRRFLRGPSGERALMNVLPVSWKLFPSRHRCLHSCNPACIAVWGRKKRKRKANQRNAFWWLSWGLSV